MWAMTPDIYMPALTWLAIGALTGWIAAPMMRMRGRRILLSVAVGMAGALLGGVLITLLKTATDGYATGAEPGTLLFVFACGGMMLATIPRSRYGARHHAHRHQLGAELDAFPRHPGKA
jgi:uncharacterized membrane protein YeaQ/YmgE (transglycosylase-associated protein family)